MPVLVTEAHEADDPQLPKVTYTHITDRDQFIGELKHRHYIEALQVHPGRRITVGNLSWETRILGARIYFKGPAQHLDSLKGMIDSETVYMITEVVKSYSDMSSVGKAFISTTMTHAQLMMWLTFYDMQESDPPVVIIAKL
jgi:hypothetical protein